MLIFCLKCLLYLVLGVFCIVAAKDLPVYLAWRFKYKSQGIHFEYIPVLGMVYYLFEKIHRIFEKKGALDALMPSHYTKSDAVAKFLQVVENRKDDDIVLMNYVGIKPFLLINNHELIKEIMLIENDCLIRQPPLELPIHLGFFQQNGPEALHKRAIFSKFFHYDQYKDLTPRIVKIINKHFDEFRQDFAKFQDEFPEDFKHKSKKKSRNVS